MECQKGLVHAAQNAKAFQLDVESIGISLAFLYGLIWSSGAIYLQEEKQSSNKSETIKVGTS